MVLKSPLGLPLLNPELDHRAVFAGSSACREPSSEGAGGRLDLGRGSREEGEAPSEFDKEAQRGPGCLQLGARTTKAGGQREEGTQRGQLQGLGLGSALLPGPGQQKLAGCSTSPTSQAWR